MANYRRPDDADLSSLGRICFDAFAAFQTRHGFDPDFPAPEPAEGLLRAIHGNPRCFAVAAYDHDNRPIGSNFCGFFDEVGGVGPITVDPATQARGVGRGLMQAVIDEADKRGVKSVRLMQDAHNATSISLYTKLGFNQKASCAMLEMPTTGGAQLGVRAASPADMPQVDTLTCKHAGASRRNEIAWVTSLGMPLFVLERRPAELAGYCIPFMLGHFVAATIDDATKLIVHAAAHVPAPHMARFFVPLNQGDLLRKLFDRGGKVIRTMNLMARGSYTEPVGAWGPSIMF